MSRHSSIRRLWTLLVAAVVLTAAVSAAVRKQDEAIFIGAAPAVPIAPGQFGPAEPQPTGTAIVEGLVVSADLERPVRRATIRLSSVSARMPRTTVTDDRGRFRFENVAAGRYTVTASKPGYLTSTYGQKVPGSGRAGTPVSVTDGQTVDDLAVRIARGGVIAGSIVDDGGEPTFGVTVRALRSAWQGGEKSLREAGSARTDDRGRYRIGALPPGEYIVMASPPNGIERPDIYGPMTMVMATPAVTDSTGRGYAPVYFPGTTSPSGATTVTLGVSEEKGAIDLQIPLVTMGRIEGTVVGDHAVAAMVQLIDLDQSLPGFGSRMTQAGPDGRFSFTDVAPGRYRVQARTGPAREVSVDQTNEGTRVMMRFEAAAPGPRLGGVFMEPTASASETTQWASVDVSVASDTPQSVSLFLQSGLDVAGRVAFDDTGERPADLSTLRVVLNVASRAASGGFTSAIGTVASDGTFDIKGVVPGVYRVAVLSPDGWRPKTFDVDGRDALDFLLDVQPDRSIAGATLTLTKGGSTLTGLLQAASGEPTADYTIVVFPDDARYWTPMSRRIQATRPATDGRYALRNLPAGTYRLVAVDDLEDGQWFDPEVLRQLSGAALQISLGANENKEQHIRVAR